MKKIVFPLSMRMKRDSVADLQASLRLLGLQVSNEETERRYYGASTRQAVRKFQEEHGLQASGEVDEATAERLNELLEERGAFEDIAAGAPARFTVKGMVRDETGGGLPRLTVRVYERELREETLLAEGRTFRNGFYEIGYLPPRTRGVYKKRFNLVVKIFGKEGELRLTSAPVFKVRREEWVNLMAGGREYAGDSEYETLLEIIAPVVDRLPLTDLVENDEHQDISFTARETGLNAQQIMIQVVAHRLHEITGLDPAVFFAFFHQNLPNNLPNSILAASDRFQRIDLLCRNLLSGIAHLRPELQREALERALQNNAIPLRIKPQLDSILGRLQELRAADTLEQPYLVGKTSLRAVLDASLLPEERYPQFLALYLEHGGTTPRFWEALSSAADAPSAEQIADLKLTFELGNLAKNHLPLVTSLKAKFAQGEFKNGRNLAELTFEDWKAIITQSGDDQTPGYLANIDGADEDEKISIFAQEILDRIERAYPTAAFAARLSQAPATVVAHQALALQFLEQNPELNLRTIHLDRYLKDKGEGALTGIDPEQRGAVIADVKALQRAFRLAPNAGAALYLLENEIHSSAQVYFTGRERFIARHTENSLSRREAQLVYALAEQTYALLMARMAEFSFYFNSLNPIVIVPPVTVAEAEEIIQDFPSLKTLFGSLDFCTCEHCNSVYSPAAYLVDILRFLNDRSATPTGVSAKDVLFLRRPDLGTIKLNCQNTNTPQPYIDLVCEVLEDAVAPSGLQRQTTLSAAELRANPEHINAGAYTALASATFPFGLPFDLWWEEARVYLSHLGLPRYDLMQAYQDRVSAPPLPRPEKIAAEYFDISSAEQELICTQDAAGQSAYWGTPDPLNDLPNVAAFLQRSGLSYNQLLELLEGGFVNPEPDRMTIERDTADCDTEEQTITNLDLPRLDRIHRFQRLWRRTGWKIWELNLLLRAPAVGAGQLNPQSLVRLMRFKELQGRLGLSAERLLGFYQNLNTEDRNPPDGGAEPALYSQLFLNPSVLNPLTPEFAVSAMTAVIPVEVLVDHIPALLAALALREEDLRGLLPKTDGALSLANVSLLYRYTALARALKLSVKDLLTFLTLTGDADPFNDLEATASSLRKYGRVKTSGLGILQLEYLLTYKPDSPAGLRQETVVQQLGRLRSELQRVRDEFFQDVQDKEGVIARKLLAFVPFSQPDDLRDALEIIRGEWAGTAVARDAFIAAHFAEFADVADAQSRLGDLLNPLGPAREAEIQTRYDFVLDSLYRYFADNTVKEQIGNFMRLENDQADLMLTALHLPGFVATLVEGWHDERFLEKAAGSGGYAHDLNPAEFPRLFETIHLLHKIALLVHNLKITTADLNWLISHAGVYQGLDFASLPVAAGPALEFARWQRLVDLLDFKSRYPEPEGSSFYAILEAATKPAALAALAQLTGWHLDDLQAIDAGLQFQFPGDYREIEAYQRFSECIAAVKTAGVRAEMIFEWAKAALSPADAAAIKQAAKSKYQIEHWLQVAPPLQDEIRERKRAALVAYLAARPDPASGKNWQDANGLFDYFLIDVEMGACQLTSRIKQAASSVQLFVQRCLMNLEPQVVADAGVDDDWKQWKWMKNYRVWEANRKVFLYPENWIEPELRDDKSPFFKELENELLQKEITDANVEAAYLNYLEKLDEVAHLEVCGFYHEQEGTTDRLHVIARRPGNPPVYFYRRRVDGASWTAWEKVNLDIKADHLIPIVYNRKLHLFWPVFTERAEDRQPTPAAQASSDPPPDPRKYWEVQLGWSVYQNGKWTPVRVSTAKLIHPWLRPKHSFNFKARPAGKDLVIDLFISSSREYRGSLIFDPADQRFEFRNAAPFSETARPWHSSALVFNGDVTGASLRDIGDSVVVVQSNYGADGRAIQPLAGPRPRLLLPNQLHYQHERLTNNTGNSGQLYTLVDSGLRVDDGHLLRSANPPFGLVVPHQDAQFLSIRPFFYQDRERAFFITPARYFWNGSYFSTELPSSPGSTPYKVRYTFYPFYHPYATLFMRELSRLGVEGLLNRTIQLRPETLGVGAAFDFSLEYDPTALAIPTRNRDLVDFSFGGAYSLYNWELFFHAPMMIAMRLSQNQRFEEALRWFHFIFDPTITVHEPSPQRYWITAPFYLHTLDDYRNQRIENLLRLVNAGLQAYVQQVADWRDNPFKPHRIAGLRPVAYQKAVLMKYLDNLIGWGDQLFRRDTIESINEATQLYVVAANILGERPHQVPPHPRPADKTYNELEPDLDAFGNVLYEIENSLPLTVTDGGDAGTAEQLPRLDLFYFCIPANDKLLAYWDRVADRLFKIRHCMNIEGVVRQLPLFEPPIDPALLVKAAAAGVDLSSVLSDLSVPLPHYRFQVMVQKAHEFSNEVKALGAALLAALEKRDAEALALLRSSHEVRLLEAVREVRAQQLAEAGEVLESLRKARKVSEERKAYYEARSFMNLWEGVAMGLSGGSTLAETAIAAGYIMAGGLKLIPKFVIGASGFGGSPHATGQTPDVGAAADNAVKTLSSIARALDKMAAMASTMGSYQRRSEEWDFQKRLAEKDIEQIDRQIAAGDVRVAIADKELANQQLQVENAQTVDTYLHTKFTNQELYDWMVSQLASVYFQSYQLAYDLAKRAERCFHYELGLQDTSFIEFGYWDSLKRGLLSGEKLSYDLRRLEAAYLDQNRRELEMTKHVSLALTDPLSLVSLKESGECFVDLPETLFDLDYPGHYLRRIKSVSISIPCIAGPYTSVNCTLTLLQNSTRISTLIGDGYPRRPLGTDDPRFVDNLAAIQSIATSHAQEDSGMFELNFRDERYLPFEGAGSISRWRIELPPDTNQFDFRTIADVILHVRYTARDSGAALREAARSAVIETLPRAGVRLFDLRQEFPNEWHRFLHPASPADDQNLALALGPEHFPFYTRQRTIDVTRLEVLAQATQTGNYVAVLNPPLALGETFTLTRDNLFGDLHHDQKPVGPFNPGDWNLKVRRQAVADFRSLPVEDLTDLFLVLHYEIT